MKTRCLMVSFFHSLTNVVIPSKLPPSSDCLEKMSFSMIIFMLEDFNVTLGTKHLILRIFNEQTIQ